MATPEHETAASARSPWFPVALKVAGIAALMTGLAGIGAASMILGDGGVAVARGAAPSAPSAEPEPEPPPPARAGVERPRTPSAALTADGKVILNLAEVDDLRRLPGIGKRRAEAILELRARLKRFRRVSDLLRVRGLGVRAVRRLTPLVVLDPPPSAADAGVDGSADAGGGR
ncbi:MAG: helix-hairpin-helix domain-containing protein [Polyangiaceae bacterium]|nr:helix-hairpin-helix domain-containing protein [Polyangiaceae bacterium]